MPPAQHASTTTTLTRSIARRRGVGGSSTPGIVRYLRAVSEVSAFVDTAWTHGLGPDDQKPLAALIARATDPALAADPALPDLRVFAALFDLLVDVRAEVPAAPPPAADVATQVLHAAAALEASRLAREPAQIDAAIDRLAAALDALDAPVHDAGGARHPRTLAARAWSDLALGDLALAIGDLPTARRRFEDVTHSGRPVALRITAMLRLARCALDLLDVEPARQWARRALTLAEQHQRYEHATRARLLLGMLHYASGDRAAMRKALRPHEKTSVLARILLASTEGASRAMPLLAEGLRVAAEQGDPTSYMFCILAGTRRYEQMGRDADALVTLSAGILQLARIAPELSGMLERERSTMRDRWGTERYAAAERGALALLDRPA